MKKTEELSPEYTHHGRNPRVWIEEALRGEAPLPPSVTLLGLKFARMEDGATFWEWPLEGRFLNGVGVVQGGLLGSFADTCMAYAAVSTLRTSDSIAGSDLRINFLKAVRSGTLRGEGRVIRRGKRVIYTEATITDETGDIIARASSAFVVL